jgi:hypothetical protein
VVKSNDKDSKNIEHQPSKGRRAVRLFGHIWLIFSILFAALFLVVAQNNNAPMTVLILPAIMILISIPLIRAGRVNAEIYYEERTEVATDTEKKAGVGQSSPPPPSSSSFPPPTNDDERKHNNIWPHPILAVYV